MAPIQRPQPDAAGFSLIEVLVSMALFSVVMAVTLGGLSDVRNGNETVTMISNANTALRSGVDVFIRDLLQAGAGLPASHTVAIPSGAGSVRLRMPGPPGSNFLTTDADLTLPAVIPRPRVGPTVDGIPTDVITVLMADNAFLDVRLSAVTATTVDVVAGVNLSAGPDRVAPGQLMMITKGSFTTLVQVTGVDVDARRLTFASGDSLNLNQPAAAAGSLAALNAQAPVNAPASTIISRVRMITYYIDATTDPARPRLVRRINNGHETVFNNNLGTAVAFDISNLQLTYDISNGAGNPGNVEMTAADAGTAGACAPIACGTAQIRKVNLEVTARTRNRLRSSNRFFENTLRSQVSLRGMAFVDKYRS